MQFWRILFNHTCNVTEFSSFPFLYFPLTPWMKYHNCPQSLPSLIYTVFTFYTFGEISGILFLCLASTELSITSSWSLLRLMSIESVMPSNHLILFIPFFRLQSFPASGSFPVSQFFIRWPKYWSFSLSIGTSNEYSGVISFRMDWLDLLSVQGTLKSLLLHHSSKASIHRCSAFFIVQLSHPYMTTGKSIALTRWTFVGKIMSLLFNMLSRLVIAFLPRSSI